MCTLLPCSTVLFCAVNVYVFYEQINDDDDDITHLNPNLINSGNTNLLHYDFKAEILGTGSQGWY